MPNGLCSSCNTIVNLNFKFTKVSESSESYLSYHRVDCLGLFHLILTYESRELNYIVSCNTLKKKLTLSA